MNTIKSYFGHKNANCILNFIVSTVLLYHQTCSTHYSDTPAELMTEDSGFILSVMTQFMFLGHVARDTTHRLAQANMEMPNGTRMVNFISNWKFSEATYSI